MAAPESLPAFDLYRELGVDRTATTADVEIAWRTRMRETHPDTVGSDAAPTDVARRTSRAARLNVARDWLIDPARRARYDELRSAGAGPSAGTQPADVVRVDPWPDRPPRPTGPGPGVFAAIGLMAVLYSFVAGVGTSILSSAGFAIGVALIALYAVASVIALFRSR